MATFSEEGMALKDTEKITIGITSPGHVVTDFMTSILDVARSQKQLGQFIAYKDQVLLVDYPIRFLQPS